MIWSTLIFVCAMLAGIISTCFLGPNNPIEELCEEIIKMETGKDFDLSQMREETSSSGESKQTKQEENESINPST